MKRYLLIIICVLILILCLLLSACGNSYTLNPPSENQPTATNKKAETNVTNNSVLGFKEGVLGFKEGVLWGMSYEELLKIEPTLKQNKEGNYFCNDILSNIPIVITGNEAGTETIITYHFKNNQLNKIHCGIYSYLLQKKDFYDMANKYFDIYKDKQNPTVDDTVGSLITYNIKLINKTSNIELIFIESSNKYIRNIISAVYKTENY